MNLAAHQKDVTNAMIRSRVDDPPNVQRPRTYESDDLWSSKNTLE